MRRTLALLRAEQRMMCLAKRERSREENKRVSTRLDCNETRRHHYTAVRWWDAERKRPR
jgi:hypothetical protein